MIDSKPAAAGKGLFLLLIRLVRAAPQVQVERALGDPRREPSRRPVEPAARSIHLGAPVSGGQDSLATCWVIDRERGRGRGQLLAGERI